MHTAGTDTAMRLVMCVVYRHPGQGLHDAWRRSAVVCPPGAR
jgi:hypothetical protein